MDKLFDKYVCTDVRNIILHYTYGHFILYEVCKNGYIDIAKSMIKKGQDREYPHDPDCPHCDCPTTIDREKDYAYYLETGLKGACLGDYIDIVKLMLDALDTVEARNGEVRLYYRTLFDASIGGNMDIVKLMIEKGAIDWHTGFYGGCISGNMDIVKFMISKPPSRWKELAIDWNRGLSNACENGHMHIVKLMIENGAYKFNNGLIWACRGGQMDIVKLMIEKGANCWTLGLSDACYYGFMNIEKLMIEKGATGCHYYCKKNHTFRNLQIIK